MVWGHMGGPTLLAFVAWSASVLHAQDARVVAANSSNGRILDVRFDPPGSTVLNSDASSRVSLQSLVFRDDGAGGVHLFAADRQRGQVLFYTGSTGAAAIVLDATTPTHPPLPDGLSLDAGDNLFGTTSGKVGGKKVAGVWVLRRDASCAGGCLPGGYAPTVGTIDGAVEVTVTIGGVPRLLRVERLEETRVVRFDAGALGAGDLLVLASHPALLLRYPAAAVEAFLEDLALGGTPTEIEPEVFLFPSTADVAPERRLPAGAEPNGMDFTPHGNLLVTAGNGTILNYRPDGTRLSNLAGFVDFATGLGQGKFKLAVGAQDAVFRAFISDRNGGQVLRFRIEADGTGTLDGVADDPQFPVGITTTTASTVPVPEGENITVQLGNLMETKIEKVVVPGVAGVSAFVFEDPRESEMSIPSEQPLHRSLFLSEIDADLPPDAEIPAYVRAFRKDDPLLGPPTFLLLVLDTTTEVRGLLAHVVEEGMILGYEPDCDDPDLTAQPRLFWMPAPLEPQIHEGPVFIDVTNDCGTTRGLTRAWSLFLACARDTRPTATIVKTKLVALREALDRAECVNAGFGRLDATLGSAQLGFLRGDFGAAIASLQTFSALIQSSPHAFSSCTFNEDGELRSRADSAIFLLQKLP